MVFPGSRRRFEGTLPIRHIRVAEQVPTKQARLNRGNTKSVRRNRECRGNATILQQHSAIGPFDLFTLQGSIGSEVPEIPGTFALELSATSAYFRLLDQCGEFAEVH